MALPASGPLSMLDIAGEFGGTAPHSLSEYYGVAGGVPTSGTISVNNFYGTSNIVTYSGLFFADEVALSDGSATTVPYMFQNNELEGTGRNESPFSDRGWGRISTFLGMDPAKMTIRDCRLYLYGTWFWAYINGGAADATPIAYAYPGDKWALQQNTGDLAVIIANGYGGPQFDDPQYESGITNQYSGQLSDANAKAWISGGCVMYAATDYNTNGDGYGISTIRKVAAQLDFDYSP